jgi:peptide/nickel transport system permease protein
MWRRALGRIAAAIVLLVVVSFLVFSLLALAPGSLETTLLGARPATPELIAAIRAEYHLDDPFLLQYARWLGDAVHLDFGRSIVSGAPVSTIVASRLSISVQLAAMAFLLAALVGIPAGLAAAAWKGGPGDRAVTFAAVLGMSAPPFVVGSLLIYLFGVQFPILPVYGAGADGVDRLRHLVLPAIALALGLGALVVRQTRAASLDVLSQDYLTFARARGLSPARVALNYALRNVALPVTSSLGLLLIIALPGAILVEVVFSLPGFGSMMVEAVGAKDVPVVQGLALVSAAYVIVVSVLVDLASAALDPRLRGRWAR